VLIFSNICPDKRITFCTYGKNVKEDWSDEEFTGYTETDSDGEEETFKLAERETVLAGVKETGKPKKTVTVREIRKKSSLGHQTAVITANYMLPVLKIALLMFARWCQENFFKYMSESFGIDSITSYLKNKLPDTSTIVNPEYKELDKKHKETSALLSKTKIKYAETSLVDTGDLSEKKWKSISKRKLKLNRISTT
jgi:hypothetical protein